MSFLRRETFLAGFVSAATFLPAALVTTTRSKSSGSVAATETATLLMIRLMTTTNPPPASAIDRPASFHTTRWSVVLAAQGKSSADARQSLETLCQQYWAPLYAYVLHRGHAEHDAQDLTQAYFARLLEKDWLSAAERERGRFRSFLLMTLKRFLANEWDRS